MTTHEFWESARDALGRAMTMLMLAAGIGMLAHDQRVIHAGVYGAGALMLAQVGMIAVEFMQYWHCEGGREEWRDAAQ